MSIEQNLLRACAELRSALEKTSKELERLKVTSFNRGEKIKEQNELIKRQNLIIENQKKEKDLLKEQLANIEVSSEREFVCPATKELESRIEAFIKMGGDRE